MTYVVAVSGGVDSVVLLDILSKQPHAQLVVAHFDHGIRDESAADAQFVKELAAHYGWPFEHRRENLGPRASEAVARERRYLFLDEVAKKHAAHLLTAHHLDDLVETIAIAFTRGTGWRGLAVFGGTARRPLLGMQKRDLIEYAQKNGLSWREDSTNTQPVYLRNRLRQKAHQIPEDSKRQLHALYAHQKALRSEIENEALALIGPGPQYSRYLFTNVSTSVALELLRAVTKGTLTRPQLLRLLHAVKTAQPQTTYQAKSDMKIRFSTRYFTL